MCDRMFTLQDTTVHVVPRIKLSKKDIVGQLNERGRKVKLYFGNALGSCLLRETDQLRNGIIGVEDYDPAHVPKVWGQKPQNPSESSKPLSVYRLCFVNDQVTIAMTLLMDKLRQRFKVLSHPPREVFIINSW